MKIYTLFPAVLLTACVSYLTEGDPQPIPDLRTVPCRAEMEASRGWHSSEEALSRKNNQTDLTSDLKAVEERKRLAEQRIRDLQSSS